MKLVFFGSHLVILPVIPALLLLPLGPAYWLPATECGGEFFLLLGYVVVLALYVWIALTWNLRSLLIALFCTFLFYVVSFAGCMQMDFGGIK